MERGCKCRFLFPDTFCSEVLAAINNSRNDDDVSILQVRDKTALPIVETNGDVEWAKSHFLLCKRSQRSNPRDYVRGTNFLQQYVPGTLCN